jgi:hypothetical protein
MDTEIREAQAILGPRAMVTTEKCRLYPRRKEGRALCTGVGAHRQPCRGNRLVWRVGTWELDSFMAVQGLGSTWPAALARAKWRIHVRSCRKRWVRQLCRHCKILDLELEENLFG